MARRRQTQPKDPRVGFADRIAAERDALGLEENTDISELLAQHAELKPGVGKTRAGDIRRNPERVSIEQEINRIMGEDISSAGFLKREQRPQTGAARRAQQHRPKQELEPGMAVMLEDLAASRELASTRPDRKKSGQGQTFFDGSDIGINDINASLDRIAKARGMTREDLRDSGGTLTGQLDAAFRDRSDLSSKANFRRGIVAASNNAQRSVQRINQEVFTGRRRRTGSSVAIPRALLSGIGTKSRSTLLGGS